MKINSTTPLRWVLYLSIGCLTFCSYAQSKITLKEFDDPAMSGYKSIVFEYEEDAPNSRGGKRTVTKEFDVEANNPFNRLNLEIKESKPGGGKAYNIKDRRELRLVEGIKDYPSDKLLPNMADSHWFLDVKEKNVVIAYILFLYGQNGGIASERTSVIKVLDYKGDVSHRIENLPFDVYSIEISNNGRYLFYGYGEYIEDSEEIDEGGFKIIDLKNNKIFYESINTTVKGFFTHPNEISIRVDEEAGQFLYSFDEITSKLYKIESAKVSMHIGHMKRLSVTGDTLTISAYQFIK